MIIDGKLMIDNTVDNTLLKAKSLRTANGEIFYWVNDNSTDSDIAVVFCHGLTADHRLFDKQIAFFAARYRILLWDMPLHGLSTAYRDFSFAKVVEDLNAIIEREALRRLVFVGQSAGGFIAQAFIDRYPEKTIGFVGIGTTPLGLSFYKKSELFWVKHYTTVAKLYPYALYCSMAAKGAASTPEAQRSFYATLVKLGKAGMLRAAGAYYREFLAFEGRVSFPFPVLLTYGEYDKVGMVAKYNRTWAEAEKFELKVVPKASHNANFDNFEAFNALLDEYLKHIDN